MSVNIIVDNSICGASADIDVLKDLFSEYKTHINHPGKTDIAIFIEHLPEKISKVKSSKKIWLINQACIYDTDIVLNSYVDIIWCRTQHCFELVSQISDIGSNAKYIGFYSISPVEEITKFKKKDRNLAVHFAGNSCFKGTLEVLRAWLQMPYIGIDLFLCMVSGKTKNNSEERKKVLELWDSIKSTKIIEYKGVKLKAWRFRNIVFCSDLLNEKQYAEIVDKAAFHIYPSKIEGYSHSINIGRLLEAVVVTTDAPPMNEFITSDIGVLVPYENKDHVSNTISSWIPTDIPEYTYNINVNRLMKSMLDTSKITTDKLEDKAVYAREKAEQEMQECKDNFKKIIDELI